MGMQKREMERFEDQRGLAMAIAIEAGVLTVCDMHEEAFLGGNEIEAAYRLGNSKYSKGILKDFYDRTELTDAIKAVVEDYCLDSCPRCAHLMAD